MQDLPHITVGKQGELAARGGHPWIYETEIKGADREVSPGGLVHAVSNKGKYIGTGFYNPLSKISLRIFSWNASDQIDRNFWKRRISYAVRYRKQIMGEQDMRCCRLIFGEADQFPGLTVDRFEDILSVQVLSLGMERIKREVLDSMLEVLREEKIKISSVYERNDVSVRKLEGMELEKGFYDSSLLNPAERKTKTVISENGISYEVDIENGQKTGFFLDQKYNRRAVGRISRDLHVLDCFTHTGGFALNAAAGGAASVDAVDISELSVDYVKQNSLLNHMEVNALRADVFDYLKDLDESKKHPYELIILDPPAFTKSGATVRSAFRGYKEINYRAMKILPRGGYLATCSCSHFMDDDLFRKMLKEAARDAGVSLRQIEFRQQSPDHPIVMTVPETSYLKFFLLQVV